MGMRAASYGVPFMPVASLEGSDLPRVSGFRTVRDPYSGAEVYVIPAVRPDWAIVHVQQADERGNARIFGSTFWDRIMTRAARRVIVTAEEIIPTAQLAEQPELTAIPEFLVAAVVHAPGGAWPTSCPGYYDIDRPAVREYLRLAGEPDGIERHLQATIARDRGPARSAVAAGDGR